MLQALPLAFVDAHAAYSSDSSPPTDWVRIIAEVGIAAVALYFLFQLHRDIVKNLIPDGFLLIKTQMQFHEEMAKDRHDEHMVEMKANRKALESLRKAMIGLRRPRPRRRLPQRQPRPKKKRGG